MPESASLGRRRAREDEAGADAADGGPASNKRRAFLHTMGQQLREFGGEMTSPQDQARGSFGTSPRTQITPTTASTNQVNRRRNHGGGAPHPIDTPESDAAPGETDQLPVGANGSASQWLWRPNEVVSPPAGTTSTPLCTFQDLLDWSQSYFDHWHPAFPFLHAPSLLEYFHQVAQKDMALQNVSELQHVVLRAVLSISLMDRRQVPLVSPKAVPSAFVFFSYDDAMNSVQRVLTEETSILSLQALVSVQLFLISMLRYNAASRLEGLSVRMAFQLRLHHCPIRLGGDAARESELRKRLFWSIFCIDRYICIRLGIPLGIRTEDADVCYPHSERHGLSKEDDNRDTRLDLLDFLARHASIRGSIMELRNQHALDKSFEEAEALMDVDAEHTKWWNHVDENLSDNERTLSITKPHQVMLIVLRFETVIALHRSVLATSKKNSTYNAALQRCISASRSVINTLHKALNGFGAFDGSPGHSGYQSTPLLWPSFTWAVWMSTFIIIFAATEKQVPRDVAYRLAQRSTDVLKHLALRGTSWPDTCTVAIDNLTARLNDSNRGSSRSSVEPGRTHTFSTSGSTLPPQHSRSNPQSTMNNSTQYLNMPHGSQTPMLTNVTRPVPTPHYPPIFSSASNSAGAFAYSASTHTSDPSVGAGLASSYLAGAGTFLGIAQPMSDNPIPAQDIMGLFNGEDMGLWNEDFGFGNGT
jgi:hypothetical protein